jgi:hypothetical protein
MRDPLLPSLLAAASGENSPAAAAPAAANRAARRGRAGKTAPSGGVHAAGSSGRARAAQGRRINPVRRTG